MLVFAVFIYLASPLRGDPWGELWGQPVDTVSHIKICPLDTHTTHIRLNIWPQLLKISPQKKSWKIPVLCGGVTEGERPRWRWSNPLSHLLIFTAPQWLKGRFVLSCLPSNCWLRTHTHHTHIYCEVTQNDDHNCYIPVCWGQFWWHRSLQLKLRQHTLIPLITSL